MNKKDIDLDCNKMRFMRKYYCVENYLSIAKKKMITLFIMLWHITLEESVWILETQMSSSKS
jgi:hypothetical protein